MFLVCALVLGINKSHKVVSCHMVQSRQRADADVSLETTVVLGSMLTRVSWIGTQPGRPASQRLAYWTAVRPAGHRERPVT